MTADARSSADEARLLAKLERAFAHLAGPDAAIDAAELQRALGLKGEYLAKRMLLAFDEDRDGVIKRDEFLAGVKRLVFGSARDKLLFAFRLHDEDGDGGIQQEEMLRMIAITLAEDEVVAQPGHVERLVDVLFREADSNGNGRLSFDEFETVVQKHPALLEQMTRTEALWISPNEDLLARVSAPPSPVQSAWRVARFLENRWRELAIVGAWGLANVVVFVVALVLASNGPHVDPLMLVGRATGRCMDLNGALILVPVMRRLLTRVRSSWVGRLVPVDEAIGFHRLVGHALVVFAFLHTAAFVVSYLRGHAASHLPRMLLETDKGLTGLALLGVLGVMWLFALQAVRRSRHFELFYFTHLLYIVWLALVIAHGPAFLYWAAAPILAYGLEWILRRARRRHEVVAFHGRALKSGVTRLDIERPPGFTFRPGDYVFLRVPAIARHEWHPFTISSAPENDAITVHVRTLGNWTRALRALVEAGDARPFRVQVDGAYGSPSAHVFGSKVAVLIGAGIGVTPYASVLESLVRRANGGTGAPIALRKAHFFWLNRDPHSFEWFNALLQELEALDRRDVLDVHLYMTDGRAGATSVGREIAREIGHSLGEADLVTGLKTKTHFGAPDWRSVLEAIKSEHAPEHVDVYFCGPPGLATKVRRVCARLGLTFRMEIF